MYTGCCLTVDTQQAPKGIGSHLKYLHKRAPACRCTGCWSHRFTTSFNKNSRVPAECLSSALMLICIKVQICFSVCTESPISPFEKETGRSFHRRRGEINVTWAFARCRATFMSHTLWAGLLLVYHHRDLVWRSTGPETHTHTLSQPLKSSTRSPGNSLFKEKGGLGKTRTPSKRLGPKRNPK